MSLCRWSADCDLYAYEDVVDGWVFEIAGSRRDRIVEVTREAARARLHTLRAEGVRFPDRAFEELDEDA